MTDVCHHVQLLAFTSFKTAVLQLGAVYLLGGSWKYHRTFLIDMVEAMMSSEVYSREARGARGLPTMEKNLTPCLISVTISQWGLLAQYLLAPVQSNFHNTLFQLVM